MQKLMVWNNCQLIWPYFIFVISEFGFSRPVGLLRTRFCSGCIRNISLFDLMRSAQTFFFALRNRHQSSIVSFFLHHVKCLKLFWGSVKLNLIIMQRSVLGCLSFEQPNTFNSKRKKRKPHDDFQESKVKLFFLSSQNKLSCWFEKN